MKHVRPGCVRTPSVWDPRTSGSMDCDVIDVNSSPDESAKESSYFHVHGSHLQVSLAWSFPSPCFGRLCSHVAWLLHEASPRKIFPSPGKMRWTYFETIWRSLKNLSPSQKNVRPPRCPKLVTGLEVQQTFSFHFSLLRHYQMPECFYVNNCGFWARVTVLSCYRNC